MQQAGDVNIAGRRMEGCSQAGWRDCSCCSRTDSLDDTASAIVRCDSSRTVNDSLVTESARASSETMKTCHELMNTLRSRHKQYHFNRTKSPLYLVKLKIALTTVRSVEPTVPNFRRKLFSVPFNSFRACYKMFSAFCLLSFCIFFVYCIYYLSLRCRVHGE